VVARDELRFEPVDPNAVGAADGLSIARIDDARDPGRHWILVRLAPNTVLPPHATPTVDYVTVVEGELELVVRGAEPVRLRAGDCVLQRGAMHSWRTTDSHAITSAVVIED
jgi:quercetin dioxygenase-like cupin family protein